MHDFLKTFFALQKRKVAHEKQVGYSLDIATQIKWLRGEIDEVEKELRNNNNVYLEDELGDIFWVYTRLLYSLNIEKDIDIQKVFEKSQEKFKERIEALENNISWDDIKQLQKKKLKEEHNNKYG